MIAKKPTALVILDGYGWHTEKKFNAIAQADTPNINYWLAHYPHCVLQASGNAVGLPSDVIGNSEVGHETIGAGRILPQPLSIIQNAIQDKSLSCNSTLLEQLALLKKTGKTLHIIGLLSDAGIHSHDQLLYALIEIAATQGIKKINIHPFIDGNGRLGRSIMALHLIRNGYPPVVFQEIPRLEYALALFQTQAMKEPAPLYSMILENVFNILMNNQK